MGRRTNPRLAQSKPSPREGLRGFDRERQGLGLHRFYTASYLLGDWPDRSTIYIRYITTIPIKIQTLRQAAEVKQFGTSRPINFTLRLSATGGKPTCVADFESLDIPRPCSRVLAAWSPPTRAEPRR